MTIKRLTMLGVFVVIALATTAGTLLGQESSAEQAPIDQLWGDFLHYIRVGRADLAQSFGQSILDSNAEPKEVYLLWANTAGSSAAISRGEKLEGMSPLIAKIRQLIEDGHKALRQDPKEIAHSIKLLGGTVRGFEMGAQHLAESGEYALPQLIQKLRDPATPITLRERITEALPRLGRSAVRPLSVACQATDPSLLEVITDALRRIEYPHAAARLKELAERKGVLPRTKRTAEMALVACAGEKAMGKTVAALYFDQAIDYYYRKASVAADIRYPTANVWYWDSVAGLTYKVVPREIFADVYAMRMCRLALKHDEKFYPAVSLWLAANLRRAAELPEGKSDPTYGKDTPSQRYFALASSAKYLQDVLARGLKDRNAAVAKGAIEALALTAGAKNLVEPASGGAQPLVEALSCSDRHVRFLAATALANALPEKRFNGYQSVLPRLIQAIRQTGKKRALLTLPDQDQRNAIKFALRSSGYEVIDNPDPVSAMADALKSPGVDVAIVASRPDPIGTINMLRQEPTFLALPVIVVGRSESVRSLAAKDGLIVELDTSANADEISETLKQAARLAASSEMTPDEAASWVIRASEAIEYLGMASNKVFDITRAAPALTDALNDKRVPVIQAASRALAVMDFAAAQRAIASKALDEQTPQDIRIACFDDLAASLRRYGNLLDDTIAEEIISVVKSDGPEDLLNAAAQTLGAMNLPSEKIRSLIVETDG